MILHFVSIFLRHATGSPLSSFPLVSCTRKGEFDFQENQKHTCSVSEYILGAKQRVFLSKSAVFRRVPPRPGDILGGVISSLFGQGSVEPICLVCEFLLPGCAGPAGCLQVSRSHGKGVQLCWLRQSERFLALRAILSAGCFKSQMKWAQAELGPCFSLGMSRQIPQGRPHHLGCVTASTHSQ